MVAYGESQINAHAFNGKVRAQCTVSFQPAWRDQLDRGKQVGRYGRRPVTRAAPALFIALSLAAPLGAQRDPHASTVMPAGYLQEMPTAERVLADITGMDSVDTRARRYTAIVFLKHALYVLTKDHVFSPGMTPDEARLFRTYGAVENQLYAGSALVPGLSARMNSLSLGSEAAPFRQQLLGRYFTPAWQVAFLRLEGTDRQGELTRSTAGSGAAARPAPDPVPETRLAKVSPARGSVPFVFVGLLGLGAVALGIFMILRERKIRGELERYEFHHRTDGGIVQFSTYEDAKRHEGRGVRAYRSGYCGCLVLGVGVLTVAAAAFAVLAFRAG